MPVNKQMFDLTGKTALITGGASGIGLAVAEGFIAHGGKVVVGSRTEEKVAKAVDQLNEKGGGTDEQPVAAGVALDVTSRTSIDHAVRKAMDVFGGLHILVNSAGVMCKKPTFDLTDDDFNGLYDIHVTGSLRCAQAAGHIFREQHEGCIINLASMSSYVDLVEVAAYAAAKNAVLGLTRSLANEWAKFGIRTNAVAPGFFPTDINRPMIEGTDRGRRIIEHTPAGRFGGNDELVGAFVYLASPGASFTNGITITVDGGYLASGIGDAVAPWENE